MPSLAPRKRSAFRRPTLYRMLSLAQLLAAHGTLLVLDAASARVQVGWLSPDAPPEWASATADAGNALFSGLAALLDAAPGRSIAAVGAFIFCEGPGSILGIRTAATALRTWCALCAPASRATSPIGQPPQASEPRDKTPTAPPSYAYQSLSLLAHALGDAHLTLIADARRDHWHLQRLGQPLHQVPSSELVARAAAGARLASPEGFRHWTPPPPALARVPYDLAAAFASPRVRTAPLFAPTPAPDAFLHSTATYKTWSPQIHRAPTSLAAPRTV